MTYSNAPEPEGINAQDGRGEGREFLGLLAGLLFCVVIGSFLFLRVGALIGPLVPFRWEQHFVPDAVFLDGQVQDAVGIKTSQALQHLADRLTAVMDMPEGMTVTVHYRRAAIVNGFATFGGHIILYDGLLQALDSEDAVAALLAHEIAHVRDRHVLKGATGAVLVSLAWAGLGFGTDMAGQIGHLGGLNHLQMLANTRAMERAADARALKAIIALYGHAGGYFDLFAALDTLAEGRGPDVPNILSSHPKIADRIDAARAALPARTRDGRRTPWAH